MCVCVCARTQLIETIASRDRRKTVSDNQLDSVIRVTKLLDDRFVDWKKHVRSVCDLMDNSLALVYFNAIQTIEISNYKIVLQYGNSIDEIQVSVCALDCINVEGN